MKWKIPFIRNHIIKSSGYICSYKPSFITLSRDSYNDSLLQEEIKQGLQRSFYQIITCPVVKWARRGLSDYLLSLPMWDIDQMLIRFFFFPNSQNALQSEFLVMTTPKEQYMRRCLADPLGTKTNQNQSCSFQQKLSFQMVSFQYQILWFFSF